MLLTASTVAALSDFTGPLLAPVKSGGVHSGADPSCDKTEVARLLWTMISLAAGVGLMTIIRPRWRGIAALIAADLLWLWIDMEGPVLIARGSHGIHLADIPVVVTLPPIIIGAARLWLRSRAAAAQDA